MRVLAVGGLCEGCNYCQERGQALLWCRSQGREGVSGGPLWGMGRWAGSAVLPAPRVPGKGGAPAAQMAGTLPRWKQRRSRRGRHRTGPAGKHRTRLFSQLLLGKHTPAATGHLIARGSWSSELSDELSCPGEPWVSQEPAPGAPGRGEGQGQGTAQPGAGDSSAEPRPALTWSVHALGRRAMWAIPLSCISKILPHLLPAAGPPARTQPRARGVPTAAQLSDSLTSVLLSWPSRCPGRGHL